MNRSREAEETSLPIGMMNHVGRYFDILNYDVTGAPFFLLYTGSSCLLYDILFYLFIHYGV